MPAVATAGGLPLRLGKYEILTPLAAGGMARIYVGRTTGIGSFERHVVLKLITPERANDHTAVQMFLDEARLAAALNHQNVAQVFEVGEDEGIHYLAMEYVHGQDLRALLAKAGGQGTRLPLELALTVVAGAAAGLHHAHERRGADGVSLGIVHRDVSPSNIMIGYDGSVKLLDFGIAKATARSVETQAGIIKGKFAYMAPEQCRGRDVDRRSDVFSLGIILYEISTQHRCFRADSDFDTMHRIVTGDVVRPTRLIQGYPQALEAIVMKALATDVNTRYQSAHQLLEALEAYAVGARMSLSTMSLGRFMREMFGDQPEPWLLQNRDSQPPPPKETTISSTNSTGSDDSHEPEHLAVQTDSDMLGSTVLELPPEHEEEPRQRDEPNASDWNVKSFPMMQPAYASSTTPGANAGGRQSQPLLESIPTRPTPTPSHLVHAMPALAAQPPPPAGQLSPSQGAGSNPSHPALPVPARRGYASGPQLAHPPALAVPAERADEPQPKRNRRAMFISLGLTTVGLAVVVAMTFGNRGNEVQVAAEPGREPPRAVAAQDLGVTAVAPPEVGSASVTAPGIAASAPGSAASEPAPEAAAAVVAESIRLRVTSEPAGAEVLLAGKSLGITPLDTSIQRGAGQATLTLHRGGYTDVETMVELSADIEQALTLRAEPAAAAPTPETRKEPRKELRKDPVRSPKDPKVVSAKEPKVVSTKEPKVVSAKEPKVVSTKDARPAPLAKEPKKDARKEPGRASGSGSGSTPAGVKKPSCQTPGQVDPFDPRPQCKT